MPENTAIRASHNPKVAGSNPAPAMQEPPLARGLLRLSDVAFGGQCETDRGEQGDPGEEDEGADARGE
jgi:hypothetical protein